MSYMREGILLIDNSSIIVHDLVCHGAGIRNKGTQNLMLDIKVLCCNTGFRYLLEYGIEPIRREIAYMCINIDNYDYLVDDTIRYSQE
ncbi:hypothetical protein CEXT_128161 [Caerostris extrusa]|uniref:Uncharacterized protein n=1 Tax=Caerostris extrusa TaxID=172846 RepID=A0AAV4UUN5_CAEEX|nr:hypothetical protein CEXT_128161 [Caerostris extrusa]